MAIGDLNAYYGTRWTPPSVNYTLGSFKNRTSEVSNDGSYDEQDWINDMIALPQSLLTSSGIIPNGTPDTVTTCQVMESLVEQVSGRSINYDCSGPVNAYVLSPKTDQYSPQSYFDGMKVEFAPNLSNTALATVDVNGLGIITIAGTSAPSVLSVGIAITLRYDSSSGLFFIYSRPQLGSFDVTTSASAGGTIDQTFDTINWRSIAFPTGPQGNMTYGVNPGVAETFTWQHNGVEVPTWRWASAISSQAMALTDPSPGNASLNVNGDVYTGTSGTFRVPNADDFNSSLVGDAGYQKFPGGLTLQWRNTPSIPDNGNLFALAFPIPFTTVLSIQATGTSASGGAVTIFGLSPTTFDIYNDHNTAQIARIFAIGTT